MPKNVNLKMKMFEKDITQAKLSEMSGVPKSYISWAISGRLTLTKEHEEAIARALGMTVKELF